MNDATIDTAQRPSEGLDRILSSRLVLSLLVAAVVFYCVPFSMADPDIWWHMRDAQIQLETHSFLAQDQFSFTAAGAAWMNHEWLAELPFYAAYRSLGSTGLYLVTLFTIEAIFLGLFVLTTLEGVTFGSAACSTIIGVLLSTVSFGPRTLLFGWLLLIAELLILKLSARRKRLLWLLPLVFALWVNTHGSWLIGIIVFGLFIGSSSIHFSAAYIESTAAPRQHIKKLIACWLACVVALFFNPYGWRLVLYPFDLALRQKLNVANVEEWKTLDFHSPRGQILLVCLAILFLSQLIKSRRWTPFELTIGALGIYMAFSYSRFLFLLAILAGPSLARSLTSWTRGLRFRVSPLVNAALVILMLCCVAGRWRTRTVDVNQSAHRFPQEADTFLLNFHPQGRVFNEFLWGGFLIWHQRSIPVFIDSRIDIFEYNGTFKDYLDIVRLKDSLALLDRYKIRYVLYESDSPLSYLLRATPQWKTDYCHDGVVLFERVENETIERR